jgi:hypothetical protein
VVLAHSEGCDVAKTILYPIFKHFDSIFVKFEQKLRQKPEIYTLRPSKIALWAKNSNFHIRIFFKYMFLEPSRGPLQIATMISEGCFQKFFDRKSEPWTFNIL